MNCKNLLSSLTVFAIFLTGATAQEFEITQEAQFTDQNFIQISYIPGYFSDGSGTPVAMGMGCSPSQPNNINTVIRDENGGWNHANSCTPVYWPTAHVFCKAAHFFDANVGVAVMTQENAAFGPTGIFRTEDGGVSWTQTYAMNVSDGFDAIQDVVFFDENNGIAIMTEFVSSSLLVTSDGGASWEEVEHPEIANLYVVDIEVVGENAMLFCGEFNMNIEAQSWSVHRLENFGQNITSLYSAATTTKMPRELHFVNENVGYVSLFTFDSFEYDYLYRTDDGGLTWSECNNFAGTMEERMSIHDMHFWDEDNGLVITGDYCNDVGCFRGAAVLMTNDGAQTWDLLYLDAPSTHNFWDLEISDSEPGIGYIVGGDIQNGEGRMFRFDFSMYLGVDGLDQGEGVSVKCYPVPSSGEFNWQFDSWMDGQLMIFDSFGRVVREYSVNGNSFTADTGLPTGGYRYQIVGKESILGGSLVVE